MSIQKPKEQLVQISEAANILGVSIDTVRRWERSGRITAVRPDGKNRFFKIEDLKHLTESAPLSISETAQKLGVSITTLRRYDTEGKLKAQRNSTGERVYSQESITTFLKAQKAKNKKAQSIQKTPSTYTPLTSEPKITPSPATRSTNTADILTHSSFTLGLPGASTPQVNETNIIRKEAQAPKNADAYPSSDNIGKTLIPLSLAGFFSNPNTKRLGKGAAFAFSLLLLLGVGTAVSKIYTGTGPTPTTETSAQVLQAATQNYKPKIVFNVPTEFNSTLTVEGLAYFADDILLEDTDLDAGLGNVFASNLVYSVTGGTGITVTGDQDLTVSLDSANLVTSLQGESGALELGAGSGITLNGLTIENSDPGSAQDIFKTITVGGTSFSAGSNTDTLTFVAGSNVTLSADASNKSVTISAAGSSGANAWTQSGNNVYLTTLTNNVGIGNNSPTQALDVTGSVAISSNLILGSDTISDLTGNGITINSQALTVDLLSVANGAGATSSYSGLQFAGANNQLSLLQGCTNGQILKYDGTQNEWECATDSGGTSGIIAVEEGGVLLTSTADTLNFSGTDFALSLAGATVNIDIDYATSGITRDNQPETISSTWTFSAANPLIFSNTAPIIAIANTGTLSITDGTNTLLSVSDNGTTGNLTATGNINAGSTLMTGGTGRISSTGNLTNIGTTQFNTVNYTWPGADGGNQYVLTTNGSGTLSWTNPGGTLNFWQRNQGGLAPLQITDDLLAGSAATSGATVKLPGTTNQNAFFNLGTGNVGIGNTTASNAKLDVTGGIYASNGLTVAAGAVTLPNASIDNAELANSTISLAAGSGSGSVALGGTLTIAGGTGITTSVTGTTYTLTNAGVTQLTGTPNQVNISASTGNITLSLPQNINTGATPTFTNLTLSNLSTDGAVYVTGGTFNSETALDETRGGTGLTAYTTGDLLYASGTNTLARRGIGNSGDVLTVAGGIPTWSSPSSFSFWQRSAGALSPLNITDDVLFGGTSTSSAKFAFINNASGIPTAVINGNLILNSAGSLQTTSNQALTIGGNTTGNIVIDSNTGSLTIEDNTTLNGTLLTTGAITAPTSSNTINGLVINSSIITTGVWNGTVVGSQYGGTGANLSAANQGAIPFFSSTGIMSALAPSTSGYVLATQGPGADPIWTNASSLGTNYWQRASGTLSPLNLSDDILAGSTATSSALVRLPGTTNQNAFFNLGTGNVGIGTTTPTTAKLDIAGSANLSSTNAYLINGTSVLSSTTLGTGVTASSLTQVGTITTGTWNGTAIGTTYGGTGITAYTTGDLLYASGTNTLDRRGIGTDGQVLTVVSGLPQWSDTSALNYWQRNTGALAPVQITNDLLLGGTATASALVRLPGLANENGFFASGGNFGIGTTTPTTARLDVAGSANLSSGNDYLINGTSVLSSTTLGTGVTASSLTQVGTLTSGSIASGFGTIATSNTITGTILNGTTGINTGASAGTQRIDSSGNLTNIGTTQLNGITYTWPGSQGVGYILQTNGSGTLSWIDPGNLPSSNYFQRIAGALSPVNITDDVLTGSTATSSAFVRLPGTANENGFFNSGGNFGIGTTTPTELLQVFGNAIIGESIVGSQYTSAPLALVNSQAGTLRTQLNLVNTGGGGGAGSAIDFYTYTTAGNGQPEARFGAIDDGNYSSHIAFFTKDPGNVGNNNLIERLWIASGGNVGIGTTTPTAAKLDVAGSANLSSTNAYLINGTSVLSSTTLGTGVTASSLTSVATITSGTWNATVIGNPEAGAARHSVQAGGVLGFRRAAATAR